MLVCYMLNFFKSFQAMVARGDLGAELPIEDVPLLQVRLYCMYSFRRTNLSLFLYLGKNCV